MSIIALHILGLSSEGGSVTFLCSVLCHKLLGFELSAYCLLTWSVCIASILLVLTLPVLGSGITILLMDRLASCSLLNSSSGGDPIIFQHLFWYFGHPEVYVIILPAFVVIIVFLLRSSLPIYLTSMQQRVSANNNNTIAWFLHHRLMH